jgi:hypothetical protein
MTIATWIALTLCWATLAASALLIVKAVLWIRALAQVDTEISEELRFLIHDLKSRDPQLEEALDVALFKLDDWEKRMNRVRLVTFLNVVKRKP